MQPVHELHHHQKFNINFVKAQFVCTNDYLQYVQGYGKGSPKFNVQYVQNCVRGQSAKNIGTHNKFVDIMCVICLILSALLDIVLYFF